MPFILRFSGSASLICVLCQPGFVPKHMDGISEQCEGVVDITDDLVVYGDTEEQYDN